MQMHQNDLMLARLTQEFGGKAVKILHHMEDFKKTSANQHNFHESERVLLDGFETYRINPGMAGVRDT